ncbi:MAG: hypothetical protein JNN07_16875 [Verrucomicrobiales bacterium]|nr:hypothetical protein [Verrucomicrobiales bacterium]
MRTRIISLPTLALLGLSQPIFAASFIQNPSFEANYNATFPSYSSIDSWSGGSGVNQSNGPFHNGGTPIPDQARVAFLQGSTSLSQAISGLTPGETYWIQFNYDARGCCGGTIDVITKFNDADLDRIVNLRPVTGGKSYLSRNVVFTPDSDAGTLKFTTIAGGDATALLDGVTIVQRSTNDVVVINPSFEASGIVAGTDEVPAGIVSPRSIAGWVGEGTYGVDQSGVGPYADNGTNPDQDNVAFIQGVGSLRQVVPNLSAGTEYELSFAVNASGGSAPHLRVSVDGTALLDLDVAAVGGAEYLSQTVKFTPTSPSAEIAFEQTVDGSHTLLLDDVRIKGAVIIPLECIQFTPSAAEIAPGQVANFNLEVDPRLLERDSATLVLRLANQNIARLVGAQEDGTLSITFPKGGPASQPFSVTGVGRGVARVEIIDDANQCVKNDAAINVVTSLIRNPSFEATAAGAAPGYGEILAWEGEGNRGLNKADGPFHDNGTIPDRLQVAFIQGSGKLRQQITGLQAGKTYWLQFAYNARNCCGGKIDLAVNWDGTEIGKIAEIAPAGQGGAGDYPRHHIVFTPSSSTGVLEFASKAEGDASVLIDAVTLVQRNADEVVVFNPSFEAEGIADGVGYIQPSKIMGWRATGGYGVNIVGVGPFSDNGTGPDQDRVFLLQGNGSSITQTIDGLTPGEIYTVYVWLNARNCCGPEATAYQIGLTGLEGPIAEAEMRPVGGNNAYRAVRAVFTAPDVSGDLTIKHTSPTGDHTLLVDNVRILPGDVELPVIQQTATIQPDGTIRIAWTADGTEGMALQSAPSLDGPWTNVGDPTPEGNLNVIFQSPDGKAAYYRLVR